MNYHRTVDFGGFAGDFEPLAPGVTRTYEFRATCATVVTDFFFLDGAGLWLTSVRVAGREELLDSVPAAIFDTSSRLELATMKAGDEFSFAVKNGGTLPRPVSARLTLSESRP